MASILSLYGWNQIFTFNETTFYLYKKFIQPRNCSGLCPILWDTFEFVQTSGTHNFLEEVVGVVCDVDRGVGLQHLDEPFQLVQLILHLRYGWISEHELFDLMITNIRKTISLSRWKPLLFFAFCRVYLLGERGLDRFGSPKTSWIANPERKIIQWRHSLKITWERNWKWIFL